MTLRILSVLLLAVSFATSPAVAKTFEPGDLRLCGPDGCKPVVDREALRDLGRFLYGKGPKPDRVHAPPSGTDSYELVLRDGFAAAVVGGPWLRRIRIHGLNCERFRRGRWYVLPSSTAEALRVLGPRLEPFPLEPGTVPRSC